MKKKKRDGRGGKRAGAGRPKIAPVLRRITTGYRLTPALAAFVEDVARVEGISQGQALEKLLSENIRPIKLGVVFS